MTTIIKSCHVDLGDEHPAYFEENGDLTSCFEVTSATPSSPTAAPPVHLGVDDHSEVSLQPCAGLTSEAMLTEAIERLTTVRDELRRLDG